MKKFIVIAGFLIIQAMISCTNHHWSFADFDYTTTYFPYQFPARTLVLGDYYFDNADDNELKFSIGAHMGGQYDNKQNVTVGIEVDESLTQNLFNSAGGSAPIKALPSSYYTLSSTSTLTIPSGSLFGMVDVQLTEAFLDDTLAIAPKNITYYVVPLRITSSTTDSILSGSTLDPNADLRVSAQWIKAPKNFTMYGIKFVNQYHGNYLLRGASVVKDAGNNTIETIVYRNKYIEKNTVVPVLSYRKDAVKYTNSIKRGTGSPGSFEIKITFDDSGNGTVVNSTRYPQFPVTGTAKFVKDADEWGQQTRDVIFLDYVITSGTEHHEVKDTLVFRDKGISFEEYVPKVVIN